MKNIGFSFLSYLLLFDQPACAWDINDLMRLMSENPGGKANFVETHKIAALKKPIQSTGYLIYTPPAHLERKTLTPKPESLVLDGDILRYESQAGIVSLNVKSQSGVGCLVDSILNVLSGNKPRLEKDYTLSLSGTPQRWLLELKPIDQKLSEFISNISISGHGNTVMSFNYIQDDGDKSFINLQHLK